jgi:hypothetical protein
VLKLFTSEYVTKLESNEDLFVVLLIDFDNSPTRLERAREDIPAHLTERVFVLGTWTNPEALRAQLGSYETIGKALADDCHDETNVTWGHKLLSHNEAELERLRQSIRPILF